MSRNLGGTSCRICGERVLLDGDPHPITEDEAGRYWSEYRDVLVVANARCGACDAKYLAWVSVAPRRGLDCGHWRADPHRETPFVDLSFRAAFNDEPAAEDLPTPEMLMRVARREHDRKGNDLVAQLADVQNAIVVHQCEARSLSSYWESYRR